MSEKHMGMHPCSLPTAGPRNKYDTVRDGDLWACTCGAVYVRRVQDWGNWAGSGRDWRWELTALRIDEATR